MQLTLVHILLASLAAVGVTALPLELDGRMNHVRHQAAVLRKAIPRQTANATYTTSAASSTITATANVTSTTYTTSSISSTSTNTTTSTTSTNTTTSTTTSLSTTTTTDSASQTTVYSGTTSVDSSALPSITDWPSCESFLHSEGINLFENSFDSFDVVIEEVTVFEILIDETGRSRETRTFHSFPQPTNYYPEFDLSLQDVLELEK